MRISLKILNMLNWFCPITRNVIYINNINWATVRVQYHDVEAFVIII